MTYTKCHYTELPTPLRIPQTSGHSSSYISNIPLWSLRSPPSHGSKIIIFYLSQSKCTVSRVAMGTLTCKIRQRVQKFPGGKSRCFAQKQRKLETSKVRVFCPVGSFNQGVRDSNSRGRTKKHQTVLTLSGAFLCCLSTDSVHRAEIREPLRCFLLCKVQVFLHHGQACVAQNFPQAVYITAVFQVACSKRMSQQVRV